MPSGKKITRKQKILCLAVLILSGLFLLYYYLFSDSRKFTVLTRELFYSELSENALSLHYTLAYPEKWGFTGEAVLSSYETDNTGKGGDGTGADTPDESLSAADENSDYADIED